MCGASAVTSISELADVVGDPLVVGLEALDAVLAERAAAVGQELDPVEQVVGDDRLEDVELEVALRCRRSRSPRRSR